MGKITLATIKSFVKRNKGQLYIKIKSHFDGMIDAVAEVKDEFSLSVFDPQAEKYKEHTLGIRGAKNSNSIDRTRNLF